MYHLIHFFVNGGVGLNFLNNSFLFNGISQEEVGLILSKLDKAKKRIYEYPSKTVIYSPVSSEEKIGFIIKGKCFVYNVKSGGNEILLNTLFPNDSFGVIALFSDKKYPTKVVAAAGTEVFFFTKEELILLMEKDFRISMNVISFLSNKISFLNDKISTFAAINIEQKLKNHLYQLSEKQGKTFSLNCKKTAESLGIGRSSLYRAIIALCESGEIKYENKLIYINKPLA